MGWLTFRDASRRALNFGRDEHCLLYTSRGEGRAAVFYTYNPPISQANWVNEEALAVRPDRLVHESTYLDVPPQWLGGDFLAEAEALRQSNERAYRHMYLGCLLYTSRCV